MGTEFRPFCCGQATAQKKFIKERRRPRRKFELVINVKTARTMGLAINRDILLVAAEW